MSEQKEQKEQEVNSYASWIEKTWRECYPLGGYAGYEDTEAGNHDHEAEVEFDKREDLFNEILHIGHVADAEKDKELAELRERFIYVDIQSLSYNDHGGSWELVVKNSPDAEFETKKSAIKYLKHLNKAAIEVLGGLALIVQNNLKNK